MNYWTLLPADHLAMAVHIADIETDDGEEWTLSIAGNAIVLGTHWPHPENEQVNCRFQLDTIALLRLVQKP